MKAYRMKQRYFRCYTPCFNAWRFFVFQIHQKCEKNALKSVIETGKQGIFRCFLQLCN